MKETIRDQLKILSNTRLEATHLNNKCAWALALLKTLLTFQLWKNNKKKLIYEIMEVKFKSLKRSEFKIAKMMLICIPL